GCASAVCHAETRGCAAEAADGKHSAAGVTTNPAAQGSSCPRKAGNQADLGPTQKVRGGAFRFRKASCVLASQSISNTQAPLTTTRKSGKWIPRTLRRIPFGE